MANDKKDEDVRAASSPAAPPSLGSWLGDGASVRELVYALGLGVLIFFRPWYDGITFPDTNFTFLWGYVILIALLASRLLFAREPIRFVLPTGIFAAFLAVVFVLSAFTVQKDATYRSLLILTGHFLLFFVAINGIRSRRAVAIVLGFFVVTSFAETLWSHLHISYVMPATRVQIANDPTTLERFFGTSEMTADIKSRLESNRATGSLLFANALACWILTGIPIAVGAAASAFLRLRASLRTPHDSGLAKASPVDGVSNAGLTGIITAVVAFLALYFYFTFYMGFVFPGEGMFSHPVRAALYCLVVPIALGWYASFVCRRHGLAIWLLYVQCGGMAAFALLQVFGLTITYSRGGMLAALGGLALLAWLVTGAKLPLRGRMKSAVRAVVALLCMGALLTCAALTVIPAPANAQQAPVAISKQGPPLPTASLDVKGENPSRAQFMNPATAFLRFSYWGSGIRMAADNFLTGVGLGNFGTVYPLYQYLGAGDVQQAHNDFLQALCETGILGFLLFTGFWAYFFVWGVLRIRAEESAPERWMLAGLFAGVIAFVLHSLVDFNFANASLAALVFLMAGLFYARASRPGDAAIAKRFSPIAGVAVLLIGGLTAGLGYQATMPQRLIGDEMVCKTRLEGVKFICQRARALAGDSTQPVAMRDRMASLLFADQTDRESIGKLYERTSPTGNQMRPLALGETPPPKYLSRLHRHRRHAQEDA